MTKFVFTLRKSFSTGKNWTFFLKCIVAIWKSLLFLYRTGAIIAQSFERPDGCVLLVFLTEIKKFAQKRNRKNKVICRLYKCVYGNRKMD